MYLGKRRNGRVVLTPVEEAFALRPSLDHLAKELEAKTLSATDIREDEEKPPELQPLTVSTVEMNKRSPNIAILMLQSRATLSTAAVPAGEGNI
jgi:hypothetical protein